MSGLQQLPFRTKDAGTDEDKLRHEAITKAADKIRTDMEAKNKATIDKIVGEELQKINAAMTKGFSEHDEKAQKAIEDRISAAVELAMSNVKGGTKSATLPEWKDRTDGKTGKMASVTLPRTKAVTSAQNVPGGMIDAWEPWVSLAANNVWRPFVTITSPNTPNLSLIHI